MSGSFESRLLNGRYFWGLSVAVVPCPSTRVTALFLCPLRYRTVKPRGIDPRRDGKLLTTDPIT